MSKSDTWLPLYIGDYLADTMHLHGADHGAYLLLLMHSWRSGPLPDDADSLAAIARTELAAWPRIWRKLQAFFQPHPELEGHLISPRLERERERTAGLTNQRRAAGLASAAARARKRGGNARSTDVDAPLERNGRHSQSHSPTEKETPTESPRVSEPRVDLPDWLPADAWAAWCAYRLKRNRKAWTQHAAELGIRELAKLRADGNDPREVIEQSIASGWTGLFALKGGRSIPLFNGGPHERNDRPAERRTYGAGGSDASRRGVLDAFPELAAGLEGD